MPSPNIAVVSPIGVEMIGIQGEGGEEGAPSAPAPAGSALPMNTTVAVAVNDEQQKKKKKKKRLSPFRWFLYSTGSYFVEEKRLIWRTMLLLMATLFLGITLSHLCVFISGLDKFGKNPLLIAIILLANTHSAIVKLFFFYWQFRGHLPQVLDIIANSKLSQRRIMIIFGQTVAICMALFLTQLTVTVLNFYYGSSQKLLNGSGQDQVKGFLKVIVFLIFGKIHHLYVSTVIIVLFNVLIRVLTNELAQLEKQIKEANLDDSRLVNISFQYLGIVKSVRQIDQMFCVYLFLLVASNIPMTITTLLRLINRFNDWCWVQFFIIFADLIACLYELTGFTAMASILHSKLIEVPSALTEQYKMHELMERNPHNHIQCLLSRVSGQSDLGISLWRFTIISKPVILTVLSLMVTYLTFAFQFFKQ